MPVKPTFPSISTTDVAGQIKALEKAVESATTTGADGKKKVDVASLEQKAAQSGSAALEKGVRAVVDELSTYVPYEVNGACGRETHRRQVKPAVLDEAKLAKLATALDSAIQRAAAHLGADAKLSQSEAKASHQVDDQTLGGELARIAIDASVAPYEKSLSAWRQEVAKTAYQRDARQNVSEQIDRVAEHHAATPRGAEAIKWAFRAMVSSPDPKVRFQAWEQDEALKNAETSWLTAIPLFGVSRRAKDAQGHLSDAEVSKHFGAPDLDAFIAKKKAEAQGQAGKWEDYLAGKDLPAFHQLEDPDFTYNRSSC